MSAKNSDASSSRKQKKVFVRPRARHQGNASLKRKRNRSEEEKDRLVVMQATRVLSQAAKKVKSFVIQHLARTKKSHRAKAEKAGDAGIKEKSIGKGIDGQESDDGNGERVDASTDEGIPAAPRNASEAKPSPQETICDAQLEAARALDVAVDIVPLALERLGLRKEQQKDLPALEGDSRSASVGADQSDGTQSSVEGCRGSDRSSTNSKGREIDSGSDSVKISDRESQKNGLKDPKGVVVARIMQHAAMLKGIESLDELVTQRRREQLALSEGRPLPPKKKANQSAKETKSPGNETAMRRVVKVNHRNSRTTFLSSLSGDAPASDGGSGDEAAVMGYSSDEDTEAAVAQKLPRANRPGQRARQAARERKERKKLRKAGRSTAASYPSGGTGESRGDRLHSARGWNEERLHKADRSNARQLPSSQATASAHASWNNAPNKTEQELHPSWAAKKEKSAVIKQFEGKKIKFG